MGEKEKSGERQPQTEKKEATSTTVKNNQTQGMRSDDAPGLDACLPSSMEIRGPLTPPAPPPPPWAEERRRAAGRPSLAQRASDLRAEAGEPKRAGWADSPFPHARGDQRFQSRAFGLGVEIIWGAVRRISASASYVEAQLDESRRAGRVAIGDASPGPGRALWFRLEGGDRWSMLDVGGGWWEGRRDFLARVAAEAASGAGACTEVAGEPGGAGQAEGGK